MSPPAPTTLADGPLAPHPGHQLLGDPCPAAACTASSRPWQALQVCTGVAAFCLPFLEPPASHARSLCPLSPAYHTPQPQHLGV